MERIRTDFGYTIKVFDYSGYIKEFQSMLEDINYYSKEIINVDVSEADIFNKFLNRKTKENKRISGRLESTKMFAQQLAREFRNIEEKISRLRYFLRSLLNEFSTLSNDEIANIYRMVNETKLK